MAKPIRGAMTATKCATCGKEINVRVADQKRGWGKFCSKSCKGMKASSAPKSENHAARPWQRLNECRSREDREDLLQNPHIIRPLYNEDGERDGEEFYAGGEPWDHN